MNASARVDAITGAPHSSHGDAIFAARFPATDAAVRSHLEALESRLRQSRVSSDRCNDLQIVLGEVLNNIVEHSIAGADDAGADDGCIELAIRHDHGRLLVETRDAGRPLPPSLLTGADAPAIDTDLDDMPEGGFGWFIIHTLVDDMMYERDDGRNLLSFSISP